MNAAYLHILVNTVPGIANLIAVLLILLGFFWKSDPVRRAGVVIFLVASLAAIPTFYSGEGAEEIVESLDGVNAVAIHPHEESAEVTFVLLCIQGVAALASLIAFRRRELPRWVIAALLVYGLAVTGSVLWTSSLGGRIHHPETRMR